MARPKKEPEIDEEQMKLLASYGLTYTEIAAVAGVCAKTIQRRFVHLMKEGRDSLNGSLKRKQYEVAMSGNCSMLIWLGKQYLDQSDKIESKDVTDYDDLMRQASEKMD